MPPLGPARAKGPAFLLALLLSCLPCAAGDITNPADCEKLPGSSASLCKREFLRTGSFAFTRLTREKECQKLRDSAQHEPCRESIANDGAYYASLAPRPLLAAKGSDSSSTGILVSGFVDDGPKTLEERNTRALETIATFTKVQAVATSILVGLALIGLLVAAVSD